MPIFSLIYILMEFILLILIILPKYIHSEKRVRMIKKIYRLGSNLQMAVLETSIIDFWFYAVLNLTVYPKLSQKTFTDTLSYFISVYVLVSTLIKYFKRIYMVHNLLNILEKGEKKYVEEFDLEIILEGLKYSR